jgi:rRNA maturation protein Rpf1
MQTNTRGIVFQKVKYAESAVIVKIYTEEFGLLSFIVSGLRNKRYFPKSAYFQSLSLLDLVITYKENKSLHQIKEVKGDKLVSAVVAKNKETGEEVTFDTKALFVEIGYVPNTKFVEDLVELNERKEIIINARNETSEKGIFAIGDATTVPYKQIIIAASEGAKAALSAVDYLNKN